MDVQPKKVEMLIGNLLVGHMVPRSVLHALNNFVLHLRMPIGSDSTDTFTFLSAAAQEPQTCHQILEFVDRMLKPNLV